MILNITYIKEQ